MDNQAIRQVEILRAYFDPNTDHPPPPPIGLCTGFGTRPNANFADWNQVSGLKMIHAYLYCALDPQSAASDVWKTLCEIDPQYALVCRCSLSQ